MSRRGPARLAGGAHPEPRYQALVGEAVGAMQAGDDVRAERAARALLHANPREHTAWRVLAMVALRAGSRTAAVEAAERAHGLDRKNPDYLNLLGIAYIDSGRYEEAIAAFRRALRLRPAFADAHYNIGHVQERCEQFVDAEASYRRALSIEPRHADAKHNLARVLLMTGQLGPALALAREAHADLPEDMERMVNLARALADTQGPRAGVEFLEQCVRRRPDVPRLHDLLAIMLLSLGDWRAGWHEYVWRTATNRWSDPALRPLPADLSGRVVCLTVDQGLGDMLFFLRFASGVRARSGTVVFQAPPRLMPLLADHPHLDHVVPIGGPLPQGLSVDRTVLLGDLPYVLGAQDVPAPLPIKPRDDLMREWRAALAALGSAPYVGVTWRAGTDPRGMSQFGVRREMLFKEIAKPLLAGAVRAVRGTLVSVQRLPDPGESAELARLAARPVHDLAAANDDLERMTGLLAVLDEYVGVSNTNMHLRAGLGLRGKVLVPYPPEFRWMIDGDSPWFPGFRVYRQQADRSWDNALTRLAEDLQAI